MKIKNEPADDEEEKSFEAEDRTKDYSELKYVREQLGDVWAALEKAFEDKSEQNKIIDECWDIYHCQLNENQVYTGSSKVYVPIVRDALAARETRFVNTLFPQAGRYADVVGNDGKVPYETIALLDYYVRQARVRELIAPALIRSGDISGQYNLYLDWMASTRHVTSKKKIAELTTEDGDAIEGSPEYDDVDTEEVVDERPGVMVLDSRNLVILPTTVDTIEEADTVDVILRFSKSKIKEWVRRGIFNEAAAKQLLANMSSTSGKQLPDTGKKASMAAGVTVDSSGNKVAFVHQVWTKLKVRGERRLMVAHFVNADLILSCKRNPYWCDRVPVLTQPVEKNPDSIWGASQVDPVKMLQYQANDVTNMGFDSAQYALLPIVMTDPEKNPRAGSMVLAMASVWLTNPNDTKFATFPALWKDAIALVSSCKDQIFQSLGVNPAMMPHGAAGKKPTQAQIAQEQQVALESTADNVTLLEQGIFSKMLEWFYELDYQYRTKPITVKKFGQLGLQADMQQVMPQQVRQRYEFKWYGTEGAKAVQQVQQMISWANVLRGLPPQVLNGRKLDLGPVIEYVSEVTFGPRLAPNVLIDQRSQLAMDPEMENQLLKNLFPVQVHEMDDDQKHIMSHMHAFQDLFMQPQGVQEMSQEAVLARGHILEHIKSAKMKAAAAMGSPAPQIGAPTGPRPGAQAQPPTGAQNPPGAVAPDNMPTAMPRRSVQ